MHFETSLNQIFLPKYDDNVQIKPLSAISLHRGFPNRRQHHLPKVQSDLLKVKETSSRELPLMSPRASPNELKISNPQRRLHTSTISLWAAIPLANPLPNPSSREKLLSNKDFLFRPRTIKKIPQIIENQRFNRKAKLSLASSNSKNEVTLEKFIFGERTTTDDDINPFDKRNLTSSCTSRAGKMSTKDIY